MLDKEGLKYDEMVERALRDVVREALGHAAEQGLPGEHHFYITFRTDHPGVEIPDQLRQRYPNEMTIVLQYQYWDLEVRETSFGVTLSFSDVPERLAVPFEAVVAFADPSVRFVLQFDGGPEDSAEEERGPPAEVKTLPVDKTARRRKARAGAKSSAGRKAAGAKAEDQAGGEADKVITLDTFRKK